MTNPLADPNAYISIDEIVSRACDEVRALSLGPAVKGGRRWTMHVPVEHDDSDVLLAGALRRQAERIRDLEQALSQSETRAHELTRDRDQLKEREGNLQGIVARSLKALSDIGHSTSGWGMPDVITKLGAELAKNKDQLVDDEDRDLDTTSVLAAMRSFVVANTRPDGSHGKIVSMRLRPSTVWAVLDIVDRIAAECAALGNVFGRISCAVHAADGKGDNTPADDVVARITALAAKLAEAERQLLRSNAVHEALTQDRDRLDVEKAARTARAEEAERDRDLYRRMNDAEVENRVKAQAAILSTFRAVGISAPCQPMDKAIGYFAERHQQMAARLSAAEARAARMAEVLSLMDVDGKRACMTAPEDPDVLLLCERVGFGAVMDSAARQWFRRDPIGAFLQGPCAASVRAALTLPKDGG
jgi:hypothetical protein